MITRRSSLQTLVALAASSTFIGYSKPVAEVFQPRVKQIPGLAGKLGVITATLGPQMSAKSSKGKFTLLELPRVLKNELDLEIIDFNTTNFPSFEKNYIEKLRDAVREAGCIATNLKMNQKVNMDSSHLEERVEAMRVYKKTIDVAQILGVHWVRPLPRSETPIRTQHISAYKELIDYAGEKGITLLIENFGWMMNDPDSVVKLADEIGWDQVAIGPDTGNWSDDKVRYAGLAKTFPHAVTCDFKAKTMSENGEHRSYDLKKCFEIGWDAGFRGPWNFEHGNKNRARAFRELGMLRDWLREWMNEKRHRN